MDCIKYLNSYEEVVKLVTNVQGIKKLLEKLKNH